MTPVTLKPPPRFVTNEWAWAYTLDKMSKGSGGGLDEGGNPKNYGAATAIYKRVAAKYAVDELQKLTTLPQDTPVLSRAEVIAFDMPAWVVMRGSAWAANEDSHLRLNHDGSRWIAERYTGDGVEAGVIEQDTAEWLVRNSRAETQEWVADHA